jgi:GNAT superfamily N-acetyltransferase
MTTPNSDSYPSVPAFPSLRLATARDVARMASLSVEGFKDSKVFRYERPGHEQYPDDAVAYFVNLYRERLQDLRAVVGVSSCILPRGSPRTGQFVVLDAGPPELAPDRDLCRRRLDIFTAVSEATEKTHLGGKVICDKFVVHPLYRNRGHGTAMLRWSTCSCDQDGVDQGVIQSHVGEPVFLSMGFELVGEMRVPDVGDVRGFTQRVAVYKARQT